MPSYNKLGWSKAETVLVVDAIAYAVANDGAISSANIDILNNIADVLQIMRDNIAAYETANNVTVNPAVIVNPAVNEF